MNSKHMMAMACVVALCGSVLADDFLSLSGYVAYSDYLFDRHTRDAARRYEATGKHDRSFNFICGLCLSASF